MGHVTVELDEDDGAETEYHNQSYAFPLVTSLPQPIHHRTHGQDDTVFVEVEEERRDFAKRLAVLEQALEEGEQLRTCDKKSAAAHGHELETTEVFQTLLMMVVVNHKHLPSNELMAGELQAAR